MSHSSTSPEVQAEVAALSPLLAGLPRRMPHIVPEKYFADLSIPTLPAEMPFAVPDGYFDTLAARAMPSAAATQTPVVAMRPGRYRKMAPWWAAAAASIALALGVQQWYVMQKSTGNAPASSTQVVKQMASESEIRAFLDEEEKAGHGQAVQMQNAVRQLSDQDLESYLSDAELNEKSYKGI